MTRPALLDADAIRSTMTALPGWSLATDRKSVVKRFKFRDFELTMAFVNGVAAVARQHDHHPDMRVGYDYCEVLFTTHDAGGLTELDATCARATQQLADAVATPAQARSLPGQTCPPNS